MARLTEDDLTDIERVERCQAPSVASDEPSDEPCLAPSVEMSIDPLARSIVSRLLGEVCHRVELLHGDHRATVSVTPETGVTIGREPGSDGETVRLELAVVSRQHCRLIALDANAIGLIDLDSANGTAIVRGEQITRIDDDPVRVEVGDVVATANGAAPMFRVETIT